MAAYEDQLVTQTAMADEDRTKRLFIGFLTSALGYDQTMAGIDGNASSPVGQYMIANPDGSFSVQGKSTSNLNSTATVAAAQGINLPLIALLVLVGMLVLK